MVLQELPLKSLIFFIHPDSPSTNLTLQMKECLHAPKGTGCLPFDHRNNHDSDLSWSGRSNEIISSSGNCDGAIEGYGHGFIYSSFKLVSGASQSSPKHFSRSRWIGLHYPSEVIEGTPEDS
ncbi:hypothetical protein V6N12_035766 [Hibiscus sabdariffa]|uniref:Uncharacterized protein n=1 Tax=Hibiscus sabdariffa TaxID=183260 RepID=A0ABR2ENN1_9ROSI